METSQRIDLPVIQAPRAEAEHEEDRGPALQEAREGLRVRGALRVGAVRRDDNLSELRREAPLREIEAGESTRGREFAQVSKALLGEDKGFGYSGPAGLRLIPDTFKLAQQIHQGEFDRAFVRAFISTMGSLTGIPAAQINRTIKGSTALAEGKTQNPAAVLFGYQGR